jgi:hypothetical protein
MIGRGQPYASPDTDMRSPARRYVHEGYLMGLPPVDVSHDAENAFSIPYRGLQPPFDPQLAPTQSSSSKNGPIRNPNEQDLSGSVYKGFA